MRWSKAFVPTLRDDPADAEAVSHKLLVRAGFMRQLMSGSYSLLPFGHRVTRKISAIVRGEMEQIGGQEFQLPGLHPAEVWQRSGRWDSIGAEMFRLQDRRGSDLALAITHEEVFTSLAAEIRSYKQLPQVFFQIHTKFRDEPRPKSGLLRVREFTMKDSYSFDVDEEGLDHAFRRQRKGVAHDPHPRGPAHRLQLVALGEGDDHRDPALREPGDQQGLVLGGIAAQVLEQHGQTQGGAGRARRRRARAARCAAPCCSRTCAAIPPRTRPCWSPGSRSAGSR